MSEFTRRRCGVCGCTSFEDGECMNCGWPTTSEEQRKKRERERLKREKEKEKTPPKPTEKPPDP